MNFAKVFLQFFILALVAPQILAQEDDIDYYGDDENGVDAGYDGGDSDNTQDSVVIEASDKSKKKAVEEYTLECEPDRMVLSVSKIFFPSVSSETELAIHESKFSRDHICNKAKNTIPFEIADVGDMYQVTVALDCSVPSSHEDGRLRFENKLSRNEHAKEDDELNHAGINFKTGNLITFACNYDNNYEPASMYDMSIIKTEEIAKQDVGQFQFALQAMTDENFNTPRDDNLMTVGLPFHFQVKNDYPVKRVEFTVKRCTVRTENGDHTYNVFQDWCPRSPNHVNFMIFDNLDSQYTKFSYRAFRFNAESDRATNLFLKCEINVCLENEEDSKCKQHGASFADDSNSNDGPWNSC